MSLVTVIAVSMLWLEFVFGVYICQMIVLGHMNSEVLLVISCVLGSRSSVCHHQFLIAICRDGHWRSFHREPDDAPSVGDGDIRASVHPGPRDMKHDPCPRAPPSERSHFTVSKALIVWLTYVSCRLKMVCGDFGPTVQGWVVPCLVSKHASLWVCYADLEDAAFNGLGRLHGSCVG